MRGLYAIVDTATLSARRIRPAAFAEAVLSARPAALQVRDKGAPSRQTLDLLREIRPLCARAGVPLFANDRVDLAALASCDGVHVGQDDLPVGLARRVASGLGAPSLAVGLSTHDAAQVEAALAEGPDYVAIGPVFTTSSKARPDPVLGLEGLAVLASRARALPVPLVAIGGITLESAAAAGALCDLVAVIAALLPARPDALSERELFEAVAARARALHEAILGVAPARASTEGKGEGR